MFSKILPIATIGLFVGLSTASYSAGSLHCYESLDDMVAKPESPTKKRPREEPVHDPIGLEELADLAQEMEMLPEGAEILPLLEQNKVANEPESKKLDTKNTVSFKPEKYCTEFDNPLVEDGEGWVQYSTPLDNEKRKEESTLSLDDPMAKATSFSKSILGEHNTPDRRNIKHRRAQFLAFVQSSEQKRRSVQLEQSLYLQQPKSTPFVYWMDQYSKAHATAEALLAKFNEHLDFYDDLIGAAHQINAKQEEYASIMSQLLWYEQKLVMMAEAYGNAQRCILAAVDASKNPENPAGFEKELRPIYITNVKNAIYCSFRLESLLNKEFFNSLSSTFLGNIQTFINESLYLDDEQKKYAGLQKASDYLDKFSGIFMNNINSFHTDNLPSVDHAHGDFGPCIKCADVCTDCLELIRNLEEKKALISRLLIEHAPEVSDENSDPEGSDEKNNKG